MSNWADLMPGVISYPYKAYKNRHTIQALWKKVLAMSNLGNTNILILGRENVGKTILLDYLNGKTNDPFYEKPDTSKKADIEALKIGEWHSLIRTTPGQETFTRDRTIDDAFKSSESLEGIIYVADWGFTNLRDEISTRKLIEEDGIDTIKKLRKKNLREERREFKKIAEQIKKLFRGGKLINWLLVVVTKADLFYSEKEFIQAEKEYHPLYNGKFATILKELRAQVGEDRFKVDAVPICGLPEDFYWNKKVKKSKIGQRENQNNLTRNFYTKLLSLK